jgi:hypothetical protein
MFGGGGGNSNPFHDHHPHDTYHFDTNSDKDINSHPQQYRQSPRHGQNRSISRSSQVLDMTETGEI